MISNSWIYNVHVYGCCFGSSSSLFICYWILHCVSNTRGCIWLLFVRHWWAFCYIVDLSLVLLHVRDVAQNYSIHSVFLQHVSVIFDKIFIIRSFISLLENRLCFIVYVVKWNRVQTITMGHQSHPSNRYHRWHLLSVLNPISDVLDLLATLSFLDSIRHLMAKDSGIGRMLKPALPTRY